MVQADVELPRERVHRVVVHHGDVRRGGREELIARLALVRIGIIRTADYDPLRLRPRQLAEVLQRAHVVVEQAEAGVQVGDAVVTRIPRQPYARAEVVAVAARARRLHHRHVEREAAVASELVLNLREETRDVLVERPVLDVVAHAEVQRQAVLHAPVVLQIRREDLDGNIRVRRQ